MTNKAFTPELYRVCDANLNRLREGIRVVEDYLRYVKDDKITSTRLKNLRHLVKIDDIKNLLKHRDSINDVLKPTMQDELNKTSIKSILIANFKRTQESARVLEEMYKLEDKTLSEKFKHIRYELYDIEKEVLL